MQIQHEASVNEELSQSLLGPEPNAPPSPPKATTTTGNWFARAAKQFKNLVRQPRSLVQFTLNSELALNEGCEERSPITLRYLDDAMETEYVRFYIKLQSSIANSISLCFAVVLSATPLAGVIESTAWHLELLSLVSPFVQFATFAWMVRETTRTQALTDSSALPTSVLLGLLSRGASLRESVMSISFVLVTVTALITRWKMDVGYCTASEPVEFGDKHCLYRIDYYVVGLTALPLVLYCVRVHLGIPMTFVPLLAYHLGQYIAGAEYSTEVRFVQALWYALLAVIISLSGWVREDYLRKDFERIVAIERAARQVALHRPFVGRILAATVPPPCVVRIFKASSTEEAAACCFVPGGTVSVSDVFDFHRWANQRMPLQVIQVLHRLFSQYDTAVAHFRLAKVMTFGDMYVCASGLEQERSPVEAMSVLEFALWQVENATYVRRDLQGQFAIRVGVGTGSYIGGFAGRATLRYTIAGEPLDAARQNVRYCRDGDQIVCCHATRTVVGDIESMVAVSTGVTAIASRYRFEPLLHGTTYLVERANDASRRSQAPDVTALVSRSSSEADFEGGLLQLRRVPSDDIVGDNSAQNAHTRGEAKAPAAAASSKSLHYAFTSVNTGAKKQNFRKRSPWNSLRAEDGLVRHAASILSASDGESFLASVKSTGMRCPSLPKHPHDELVNLQHLTADLIASLPAARPLLDAEVRASPNGEDDTPSGSFWDDEETAMYGFATDGAEHVDDDDGYLVDLVGVINADVAIGRSRVVPAKGQNPVRPRSDSAAKAREIVSRGGSTSGSDRVIASTLRSLADTVLEAHEKFLPQFTISHLTLRFARANVEAHYQLGERKDTYTIKLATLSVFGHVCVYCLLFWVMGRWAVHEHFGSAFVSHDDGVSLVVLVVAACILLARLILLALRPDAIDPLIHVCWCGVGLATSVAAMWKMSDNVLVLDIRYLLPVHFGLVLAAYRQVPWYHLSLAYVVFSVVPIGCVYTSRRGELTVFTSVFLFLWIILVVAVSYHQERMFRNRFTVACYALSCRALAADKLETQILILNSVLPNHVVHRVLSDLRTVDGPLPPFVEQSRTLVVTQMRFNSPSQHSHEPLIIGSSTHLQDQMKNAQRLFNDVSQCVDVVASAVKRCAKNRSIELIQTIGDVFVLAGPFMCTTCVELYGHENVSMSDHHPASRKSHATESLSGASRDAIAFVREVAGVIRMANLEQGRSFPGFAAVLDCEEAHGALLGDHTLNYHLFGVAMRHTASLLEATPELTPAHCVAVATHGFRSVMERGDAVSKALANIPPSRLSTTVTPVVDSESSKESESLLDESDKVFGSPMRWAARGSGVIRVYPILIDSNLRPSFTAVPRFVFSGPPAGGARDENPPQSRVSFAC